MPNIINKIAIPDKYDPTASFSPQMIFLVGISMILILTAIVVMIHFKRKKQKGSWFAFMVGISVYLLFYNFSFLPNIILNLLCLIKPIKNILDDSDVVNCIVVATVTGTLAFFGMTLVSCILRKRFTTTGDNFSVGLAIAVLTGIFSLITLFSNFIIFIGVNQMGLQSLADKYENVKDLESMFDVIFDMMDVGVTDYFFRSISTIAFMAAQLLLIVPIISYVKKKMSVHKLAGFAGLLILMKLFQSFGGAEIIPAFVEAICVVGIAVGIFFLVKKDYVENCKDEYKDTSDCVLGNFKKNDQQDSKAMPKFDNLSKL